MQVVKHLPCLWLFRNDFNHAPGTHLIPKALPGVILELSRSPLGVTQTYPSLSQNPKTTKTYFSNKSQQSWAREMGQRSGANTFIQETQFNMVQAQGLV